MAMTKEDYVAMGRNHAQNAAHPGGLEAVTTFKRTSQFWQARAYWEGYDAEVARRAKPKPTADVSKLRVVDIARMAALSSGWRGAAGEHVMRLAVDHNQEGHLKRRARLHTAIRRMVIRHSPERRTSMAAVMAVPMTNPLPHFGLPT